MKLTPICYRAIASRGKKAENPTRYNRAGVWELMELKVKLEKIREQQR
jgi:hypothetical protein